MKLVLTLYLLELMSIKLKLKLNHIVFTLSSHADGVGFI